MLHAELGRGGEAFTISYVPFCQLDSLRIMRTCALMQAQLFKGDLIDGLVTEAAVTGWSFRSSIRFSWSMGCRFKGDMMDYEGGVGLAHNRCFREQLLNCPASISVWANLVLLPIGRNVFIYIHPTMMQFSSSKSAC